MALQKYHGSIGYFGLKQEAAKGTALTPDTWYPLFAESMQTNMNFDEAGPIVANDSELWDIYPGMRTHVGNFEVLGEPNVAGYIMDAMCTKGTTTGSDPYTHPFTFSQQGGTNSYTYDFLVGRHVKRFFGCEVKALAPSFSDNKMHLIPEVTALGSFTAREVASVSGTGPTTVVFKATGTDYDTSPTTGLAVGDLVQFEDISAANGTFTNGTVASIVDAESITVTEDWSTAAAADVMTLRAETPSLSLKFPFMQARTELRFGATASAALSATHTPINKGSASLTLRHAIVPDEGLQTTGSFDPSSLPRGRHGADVSVSLYFDSVEDYNRYLTTGKRALVIRAWSEGTTASPTYEMRFTFNNLKQIGNEIVLPADDGVFETRTFKAVYDTGDAQVMDVKVLNAISSI